MTDLIPAKDLEFRGVTSTRTALTFEHDMSPELWDALLKHIMVHRNAANWWMGDALNKGEEMFGEEMPQWVEDALGSTQTVNNVMRVCRVFKERPGEKSRRREDLSFSHHMEVAGLKESKVQDRFLEIAAKKGWDRDQLRSAVRDHKQELGLSRRRSTPEPIEDAETVEEAAEEKSEPLAREPEVIEGKAVEVEPEATEEPFDRVADMQKRWDTMSAAEQIAVFKWSLKRLQVVLSHEQKELAQAVIDRVEADTDRAEAASGPSAPQADSAEGEKATPPNSGGGHEVRTSDPKQAGPVNLTPPVAPDTNVSEDEALEIPKFLQRDADNNFVEPRDA